MTLHSSAIEVVRDAADRLHRYGSVTTELAAGSRDPWGASVADLVFTPTVGPSKDLVFLVEYKFSRDSDYLPSADLASSASLAAGLNFPGVHKPVHVLSTNAMLGTAAERLARDYEITCFGGVSSGEELAQQVATLAGIAR
jgi:hypothetical protein